MTDQLFSMSDLDVYQEQLDAEFGTGTGGVIMQGYVTFALKHFGKGVPAHESTFEIKAFKPDSKSAEYKDAAQRLNVAAVALAKDRGLAKPAQGAGRDEPGVYEWKTATAPHLALAFIATGPWFSKGVKGEGPKVITETIERKRVNTNEKDDNGKDIWHSVPQDGELMTAKSVESLKIPLLVPTWFRVTWQKSVSGVLKDKSNPDLGLRAVAVLAEVYPDEKTAMAAVAEAKTRADTQAATGDIASANGTVTNPFVSGFTSDMVGQGWTLAAWLAMKGPIQALLDKGKELPAVAAQYGVSPESVQGLLGIPA